MKHSALLIPALAAACGADVPDKPTWLADVQPILRANCVRCHGADPVETKLAKYRLDRSVADDILTLDAFDKAGDIVMHAVDHTAPAMPPDYLLTDRQQEILSRWAAAGAPKGNRANRLGRIELFTPTDATTADQAIDLTFRAWDEDLDGLSVALWARDPNGETFSMVPGLGGGMRAASIDAGTLTSKANYEIYAIVDDGFSDDPAVNKSNEVTLMSVFVDHGLRGTAPRVLLKTPNDGGTLVGTVAITWSATDPDAGDTLKADLDLIPQNGGAPIVIQHDLDNLGTLDWKVPASVPVRDAANIPIPYTVRVTVRDTLPLSAGLDANVRSDESDTPFFLEQAVTTDLTWLADTKPLFATYCTKNCHDASGTGSLPHMCLLQYKQGEGGSACSSDDTGALENKGAILQQLQAGTMPKAPGTPLPQATSNMMINWLLGGAPYGDGSTGGDAAPTLTWTSPGTTGPLVASGGMAMLAWSVADDMGLVSDSIAANHVRGTNAGSTCAAVDCSTIMANQLDAPITITSDTLSGTSQSKTFAWAAPGTAGCYCVTGSVKDTTHPIAGPFRATKPVKF